jgi:phosphoribosyl-AMP cyclohydrolase
VVVLRVAQRGGAACHTGRRTCFFRVLEAGDWAVKYEPLFDPEQVYRK